MMNKPVFNNDSDRPANQVPSSTAHNDGGTTTGDHTTQVAAPRENTVDDQDGQTREYVMSSPLVAKSQPATPCQMGPKGATMPNPSAQISKGSSTKTGIELEKELLAQNITELAMRIFEVCMKNPTRIKDGEKYFVVHDLVHIESGASGSLCFSLDKLNQVVMFSPANLSEKNKKAFDELCENLCKIVKDNLYLNPILQDVCAKLSDSNLVIKSIVTKVLTDPSKQHFFDVARDDEEKNWDVFVNSKKIQGLMAKLFVK